MILVDTNIIIDIWKNRQKILFSYLKKKQYVFVV